MLYCICGHKTTVTEGNTMSSKLTAEDFSVTMSYEISFQFVQGELDWTDNLLFDAYSVSELIKQVKTYIAQFDHERDEDDSMTVLFAQVLNDDLDADDRDITDLFPEDMLTE